MTATLDLTKVTTDESGTYTCVARNRQKQTRAYFTLTVHGELEAQCFHDVFNCLLMVN